MTIGTFTASAADGGETIFASVNSTAIGIHYVVGHEARLNAFLKRNRLDDGDGECKRLLCWQ